MKILENVSLSDWHTFRLPAVASGAVRITSPQDLEDLHQQGFFQKRPFLVLGEGSNTVFVSDLARMVLRIEIPGIERIQPETSPPVSPPAALSERLYGAESGAESSTQSAAETGTPSPRTLVLVRAGAGVSWDALVDWALDQGLAGIENLAGIPGTCGAAPIQNIGAYGAELSDVFHSLQAFSTKTGQTRTFFARHCHFGYRDSIFKSQEGQEWIILSITLMLTQVSGGQYRPNIRYQALAEALQKQSLSNPIPAQVARTVREIRASKLPDPRLVPNAGSFFKNPIVGLELAASIAERHPDLPVFPQDDGSVKVPAGWLIERAGWKGRMLGNVGTWKNQALVLIQNGSAAGVELLNLVKEIQRAVGETFGIHLQPEVNIITADGGRSETPNAELKPRSGGEG